MKLLLATAAFFAAASAYAQNAAFEDMMQSQIDRQFAAHPPAMTALAPQPGKANEIKINGITYSGILVELAKTGEPLQLINPWAPPEFGSPADNTAFDATSGEPLGLKILSIEF